MNIIFVSRRRGQPRKFDLRRPLDVLAVLAVIVPVCGLLFFAGVISANRSGDADVENEVDAWRSQLVQQAGAIASARRKTQEDLTALSRRLGEVRAHVIRLEALGRRLVQMAGLDGGEFNFDYQPPLGGPIPDNGGLAVTENDFLSALDDLARQVDDRDQQLRVLEDFLLSQRLDEQIYPEGRPVQTGWISSYFGRRSDPFTGRIAHHEGIDFAGREGAPILTVGAGVITWSGDRSGYGLLVEVNHGNGYVTRYGHNSENLVMKGETVVKGQTIARMGSTGRATGPNLHFEVLYKGRPVDPRKFIDETL